MDTRAGDPQAVSGKQILTHQILWFPQAPKNRESSGLPISVQKYFLRFFITASPEAGDVLWISESDLPAAACCREGPWGGAESGIRFSGSAAGCWRRSAPPV